MSATLLVSLLPDREETSFSSVVLHHAACLGLPMSKNRSVVTGDFTLHCKCGLKVVLPESSGAIEEITKIALGYENTQLGSGSYFCVTEVVLAVA